MTTEERINELRSELASRYRTVWCDEVERLQAALRTQEQDFLALGLETQQVAAQRDTLLAACEKVCESIFKRENRTSKDAERTFAVEKYVVSDIRKQLQTAIAQVRGEPPNEV